MKAVAVLPGKAGSVHLAEVPAPRVADVPNGRGVLVKILRVGVDGTDKEINAAEYGAAPDGCNYLIIGHESFGRVEDVGPNVTEFKPGDYVALTVRRPGSSLYDQIGTYDMTTDDTYFERGINLRHGFLTEYVVDEPQYIIRVPRNLKEVGVLMAFDLILEGTGYSPLVFEAMNVLAKNGVLAMVSVTGGSRQLEVPADKINLGFVLGNKVAFGSVNANREYFETGVKDLSTAELQYPVWLKKLLTHPVKGLDSYEEIIRLLTDSKGSIKVYCEVAAIEGAQTAVATG